MAPLSATTTRFAGSAQPEDRHTAISFGTRDDSNQNGAVFGVKAAEDVFEQDVPLGQSFDFRGQPFIVRGMFNEFRTAPLSAGDSISTTPYLSPIKPPKS